NDGVNVNIVDSIAEELRLTNNNSIQGVSVTVDDTAAGGAALLTELFIHSNFITGNTTGAGVSLNLNNVDQFVSITGNSITANSGDGIVFDQTDGDLSGEISGNNIANNTGHGINFTPSTTNPTPTGGAPGVPAYAGIPGPTDTIDFAAPRNEVQLITFAGVPTGGTFTISYTGGNGVTQTTAGILATATASQVKAAMVAAFSDIGVDDVLVNGNFQDGYEIEFVNAAGGVNVNPLTVDVSGFNSTPATVTIFQDTSANVDEIQHIDVTGTPAFGTFQLNFLGNTITQDYTQLNASDLETALNFLANIFDDGTGTNPFTGSPIQVTGNLASGFDILFLDAGTMHDLDVPQVTLDASGLNLFVNVQVGPAELNPNKPAAQTITFQDVDGNIVTPSGGSFQLTFQTETTGDILIDPDPNVTAANIDAALQALFSATTKTGLEGDFIVSGDFANGFVVEFNEIQHLSMLGSFDPTFGSFQLTFLGSTATFAYDISIPSAFGALQIQNALNTIANNSGLGYTGSPVSVAVSGNGYDIIFLDSGTMADADVQQITVDASRMRFDVDVANLIQGNGTTNEQQTLDFADFQGNFPFTFAVNGIDITNPPIGAA
ncbi:MAG TPA: hypothetical protein DCY03_11770, partial [Planctomycetaceae bacterium]|nr:hypothetical protein [Planctomycetaceae bacterium]